MYVSNCKHDVSAVIEEPYLYCIVTNLFFFLFPKSTDVVFDLIVSVCEIFTRHLDWQC